MDKLEKALMSKVIKHYFKNVPLEEIMIEFKARPESEHGTESIVLVVYHKNKEGKEERIMNYIIFLNIPFTLKGLIDLITEDKKEKKS